MGEKKIPWLIQYNPLYLLSAVLLLFGVYKLNLALIAQRVQNIDQILFVINEFYQFTLIAALSFLVNKIRDKKSSRFLAGLSFVMLCDPTYMVESFTLNGFFGYSTSIAWLLLFMLKIKLITKLLNIKLPEFSLQLFTCGAVIFLVSPHLLVENMIGHTAYKVVVISFIHFYSLAIKIAKPYLSQTEVSSFKIFNLFVYGGFGFFFLRHCWINLDSYDIVWSISDFISLLFIPIYFLKNKKELLIFSCSLIATLASLKLNVEYLQILSVLILVKSIEIKDLQMVLLAIATIWLGVYFEINSENYKILINLVIGLLTLILYIKTKIKEFLIPMGIGGIYYSHIVFKQINGELTQSIFMVLAGFICLISALAIHWFYLKKTRSE